MIDINFRKGYFYGVCLICIIIFIFANVSLINTVIDAIYPVKNTRLESMTERKIRYQEKYPDLEEEKITKMIREEMKNQKKREEYRRKRRLITELAKSITLLVLVIPIYLFHWRKVEYN
ncbi:hypothetical protein JCM16358_03070 [Halanaerocella petrolearia]